MSEYRNAVVESRNNNADKVALFFIVLVQQVIRTDGLESVVETVEGVGSGQHLQPEDHPRQHQFKQD